MSYETVRELMSAAVEQDVRPGFVAVVQTHGSKLNWNPHIHALVSRGGWTSEHEWTALPYMDARTAELAFRHKVLRLLLTRGLLPQERATMLVGWRHHTGFSVHNQTTVAADQPDSLERLRFDEGSKEVGYRHKPGHAVSEEEECFDALEFLARVLVHIPEPRLHLTRYYGAYSAVVRARRRRQVERAHPPSADSTEQETEAYPPSADSTEQETEAYRNPALRRRWAGLIRRIYETDPLLCQNCGQTMAIVSFITERRVILKILRHLETLTGSGRGPPLTE